MTSFICCPCGGLRGFPPFAIFPVALSNGRRRAPPAPEIDFRLRPFSGSPGRRRRSRDGGRTHARGDADGGGQVADLSAAGGGADRLRRRGVAVDRADARPAARRAPGGASRRVAAQGSEERRGGKSCGSYCRLWRAPFPLKKKYIRS